MHNILFSLCLLALLPLLAAAPALHAQPVINKCIVNGKTIYSDQKCPKDATKEQVKINHATGIVSADRETVTDTINRMHDERWVSAAPGRSITRTTTRDGDTITQTIDNPLPKQVHVRSNNKKAMCDSIEKRITHLDALARQPQSARTQERIKQDKAKERSKAFDAGC